MLRVEVEGLGFRVEGLVLREVQTQGVGLRDVEGVGLT